jgi:hypothetical protein
MKHKEVTAQFFNFLCLVLLCDEQESLDNECP